MHRMAVTIENEASPWTFIRERQVPRTAFCMWESGLPVKNAPFWPPAAGQNHRKQSVFRRQPRI